MGELPGIPWLRPRLARAGHACLLAWLVLVLCAPSPAVLMTEGRAAVESGGEDPASKTTPPAEEETREAAIGILGTVLGRPRILRRPYTPASVACSTQAWPSLARPSVRRHGTGHFLAEGRSLRHWLQSQTC